MKTLYDFGLEVQKIREAINSLEVKGAQNASLVLFAYKKCNEIIQEINKLADQQNPPSNQNGEEIAKEEVEMNGESDSGTTS